MSRNDNRFYHLVRSEEELQRAEEATDPGVAKVHRELAILHRRQFLAVVGAVDHVLPPPLPQPDWASHREGSEPALIVYES
jgi:hypothetical protein